MNKKALLLLIPLVAAGLAGCEQAKPNPPAPQCDSATVTLDKQTASIVIGGTIQLNASISVEGCPITWSSSNEAVASVDQNGLVTGHSEGTANITANGVVCVVTVTDDGPVVVHVTGVEFKSATYDVKPGNSVNVLAEVTPSNATDKKITYTLKDASPADCATISSNIVTAVKEGTVKVVATTSDGGFTAEATVVISSDAPDPEPVHAGTEADPYDVNDAVIVGNKLAAGAKTENDVFIKGVAETAEYLANKGGSYSFEIGQGFLCYSLKNGADGKAFADGDIAVGDEVLVKAKITKFHQDASGDKPERTILETSGGYVVNVKKPGEGEPVSIKEIKAGPTEVEQGTELHASDYTLTINMSGGGTKDVLATGIIVDTSVVGDNVPLTLQYTGLQDFVTTIKVNAPAAKVVGDFYRVKSQADITAGTYLLVWEGTWTPAEGEPVQQTRVFTGIDAANDFVLATNDNGHIAANSDFVKVELEEMTGGFAFKVVGGTNDGKYMYGTSGSNGLKFGTDKKLHTIEHKSERDVIVCDTTYLSYNTNSNDQRFRYYKADTQKPVQLYKMHEQQIEPAVTSVVVTPAEKTLDKNEEANLSAVVNAVGGASEAVTWSSSDPLKVSVDANGKIKGLDETTEPVIITATSNFDNSKKGTCSVTVTSQEILPEVISVELSDSSKTLTVNGSFTLTPTVSVVGGASEAVTWSSSDSTKVSVADGVVTAVEVTEEPVVITATSVDDPTKSATCSVTVVAEKVIDVDKTVELTSDIITHEKPTDYGTNENGDYAYVNLLKNTQGTPESIQGSGTTSDSRPDKSIIYNSIAFSKAIVGIKLEIGTKAAGATATANLTFGTSAKAAGSNKVTLSGSSGTADYKTLDVASSSIEFKLTATDCKYFALNYTSGAVYFSKITLIFDESYVPAQPTVKSVSVNPAEKEISVNEEFTLTPVVEVENGAAKTVTWSSSDESKVSVDANGKIKGLAETTEPVTITATSTEDTEKSGSCSVTVVKAQLSNYTLLTSATDLYVGDKVVIAAAGSSVAAGTASDKNNRPEAAIVKTDNKLGVLGADVQVFELEAGTVDGTYAFKTNEGYLYAVAGSNYLKTKATKDSACDFSIACADTGVATVSTTLGSRTLRYNSGSKIFSCYTSGQADIALYHIPYNEPTEGLKSITVSGPTKTEYELNEAFDPNGLVVTASYYGDAKDTDVTASATYDAPDMTTEGIKEVVVSYTEGGVTKTDSFSIKVGEVVAEKGTLENPYTGAEAYAIAEAMAQTKTAASCGSVYIKGTVQKFNQTFDTKYGNYSFTIDGDFICWQLKNGESGTAFVGGELSIGDEVIVKAEIQKFSDTQMETMGGYIHSITRGTSTIEVDSSSSADAVVDLHDATSAVNGSTFTFDVSVDADHEIASVKVNGSDATVVTEGTYSFVVDGPAKIIVETKNTGEASPEVYKSVAFTQANCKQTTGSYTGTAKFASDSINYECANFNTNNKTWNLIKCGRKDGNASVASIVNTNAIDEEIVSITITFNACTVEKLNEAYLLISDSSSFDGATKVSFDVVSNQAVTIKIPAEAIIDDGFYKIVFDCAAGDANGFIAVESVDFNYIPA